MLTRLAVRMVWTSLMALIVGSAPAEDFPNKPIRIIASPPGGGNDFVARLIAQGVSGPLGQPVIVENRPSGIIPAIAVSKASPDGYTLFLSSNALWLMPLMQDNVPYDPVRDFSPVALAGSSPNIFAVHASLAVNSAKELIALAKARPGELNYASSAAGSSTHLAGELFKHMAGVNIVRIPYKGGGPALNALMGGQVQIMFPTAGSATPHLKSGRLKALAVTSAQPSALFPGMPTVSATGLPGYEIVSVDAIFAPPKTPAAVVRRLNQEIVQALNRPEIKEKLFSAGTEIVGSSPEQFAAKIKSDMSRMGKVIKDAGIRAE